MARTTLAADDTEPVGWTRDGRLAFHVRSG